MADKPTKSVLPMVAIGAGLLVMMALIGQRLSAPAQAPAPPKVVQALPDEFDRGEAGLSVGAELEYVARIVGDWRGPGGACAVPIQVRSDSGDLIVTEGGGERRLAISLVKPGVVRAEVAEPAAERGREYEFNVGLLSAEETLRAPITVARPGHGPQTWEPCGG